MSMSKHKHMKRASRNLQPHKRQPRNIGTYMVILFPYFSSYLCLNIQTIIRIYLWSGVNSFASLSHLNSYNIKIILKKVWVYICLMLSFQPQLLRQITKPSIHHPSSSSSCWLTKNHISKIFRLQLSQLSFLYPLLNHFLLPHHYTRFVSAVSVLFRPFCHF